MNNKHLLWLVTTLCIVTGGELFAATQTNTWPFTTPSQYMVSDPTKIEVADGVAKLLLQASKTYYTAIPEYLAETTSRAGVGVGPDVCVSLSRTGTGYFAYGTYESPVIDGGEGNTWQTMASGVHGRYSPPFLGEYVPTYPGVVALYHFNNSRRDEVTLTDGSYFGTLLFTTNRLYGSHAFKGVAGSYFQTVNSALLHGVSEFTLMCWIYVRSFNPYAGVVTMDNGLTGFTSLSFYGGTSSGFTPSNVVFYVSNSRTGAGVTALKRNTWYHLAGVRKSSGQLILYINGRAESQGTVALPGPMVQNKALIVGADGYDVWARSFNGDIDEVVILNRALTEGEVAEAASRTTSVGFQLRSGTVLPLSSSYTGPDGTQYSYYRLPYSALLSTGSFSAVDRFLQYKTDFVSDTVNPPYLDAVRAVGSSINLLSDTLGGYYQSYYGVATTNVPPGLGSFVGFPKTTNGGYVTNGTFTSRVYDGGSSVTWNQIGWSYGGTELSGNLSNLEGLWRMNETWSDASGKGHSGAPSGGVAFSSLAKLGTHAVMFNGVDGSVYMGSMGTTIQTMEWWMKPARASSGILQLMPGQTWISITNGLVSVGGSNTAGAVVYVNGSTQPALLPGWNHVAVSFSSGVSTTDVTVGQANGVFFEGVMDELAMYSRQLPVGEIKEHYVLGRRSAAGQIRFQARADNVNPPQTPFVGQADTIASYFVDPSGSTLPNSFLGKRYFQYRAYLTGDGDAAPALNSVSVRYAGSATFTDDTREEFGQGSYDAGGTEWKGDTVSRDALQVVGPGVLDPLASPGLMTLWHMDDAAWVDSNPTVKDSSGNGRNGTPQGSVLLSVPSRTGSGAATFLTNGVITASGGVLGSDDFSVSLWWSSTMTGRCALATTYSTTPTIPYYAIELNPTGAPAGSVAFVLSDGTTVYRATSFRASWNDGNWHHVSAVKQGTRIYLYLDGACEAFAQLATANINLGAVLVSLGKYGGQNIYFAGMMDEVATHGRALAEWEIAELAAAGYDTRGRGYLAGPVMDGGQPSYWERVAWVADGPYGREHVAVPTEIIGLWHCNVISNGVTSDESGYGFDGAVEGGGTVSAAGKFGNCLALINGTQRVRIPDDPQLALNTLSWETWVWLETEANAVIIDKSNGGVGVRMGTDGSGRPYFRVGLTTCTGVDPLRIRQWCHVAGTYDGASIRLYVNGRLRGRISATENPVAAVDAYIGGCGLFDEVALYNRVLVAEEILDHYRAGAVTLGFQARSWTSGDPGDFLGPDGTTNTLFTQSSGSLLTSVIPLNRYFQYRAVLATEDYALTPLLQGIRVDMSGYPSDNPWVAPADAYGTAFLGKLLAFMHTLATNNNDSEVKYQISGNNGSNWYAWVDSQWTDVTAYTDPVSSWNMSNARDIIHANIGSFYEQLYPRVGGVFKFKAFLKSDAIKQIALDEVRLAYAPGRVVVQVPNGQEVGNEAWLIGVPYTIQWTSAGSVSSRVKLEYSPNGGSSWTIITNSVPNAAGTNTYSYWITPGTVSDQARVRVTDVNDTTISDVSDSNFSLVERFRMLVPNGGEKWYTGRTNRIVWASAINLGLLTIDYAAVESNYNYNVGFGIDNTQGSASNQYLWATPQGNPALLSETGKMRIKTLGNQGTDESDNVFTLAGIEITNPTLGSAVKRGGPLNIRWVSAGAGGNVAIDFSTDGGTLWTNVVPTAANVLGSNLYTWVAIAPPTDNAQLRIRSLSDTNVVGLSAIFTLADIDVTAPTAGTNWLMSTTNTIKWTSGGAGDKVNIYWSIDSGVTWTPIVANYTNMSGPNSYNWVVHRFPVSTAKVKVESVMDPENLWSASPDFNVAGVRVFNPNGGETWVKDVANAVQWAFQSVGQNCTVQFSYDGGITYDTVGGPGVGLSDRAYVYTAIKPTVRAKAKVITDNPTPYTNVFDESDAFFTVAGITVTAPSNGVSFTIGTTNAIAWTSAGSEDPLGQAKLYYSAGSETNLIASVGNNQAYPGGNTFPWPIQPGVTPSATARIVVKSGAYTGVSDPFVLRGIKFTSPTAGTVFDIGGNAAVAWVYAGLDASAVGYFYLSTDGGSTFSSTPINAAQIWSVQAGAYPWVVAMDTVPTTNAVLEFRVTASSRAEDIGFKAKSQPFTIRGFKVLTPNAGTAWALGQTNQIVWLSAQGGTYGSLYYAANGVTYDMARPIAMNLTLGDGTNRYNWGIEAFRLPSTNARVKVVSTIASAESAAFRMNGLRVTSPMASDVWAKDETNRIAWTAVGTVGTYDITLVNGGTVVPIATGVTGSGYDWIIPLEAVGSNVYVQVQDVGGIVGRSDLFRIVGEPTIGIMSPAPGEFWKVSQTYDIQWSKGGKMDNDFHVMYSTEPFIVTNEIFNGVANFDATNNIYSVPWTVPDRLGATIIIVENNLRPTVRDVSQPFYVVGMFTLLSPNGGETNVYALKPITISWFTRGTVPEVNLYYSTTPLHEPESWVRINSTPVPNNGGGVSDQLTTFDWTTVDIDSSTVRLRVEQADRPGAYDDSDADFAIRYYDIVWHVYDIVTGLGLDKLSVSDSSGWSAGNLTDPVVHRYPYGTFNTVWARENFFNNVVFGWEAEPSRTIDVPMKRSEVEPDYTVMANFAFDASSRVFRANCWIERKGKILTGATKCVISVFDKDGGQVEQVTSTVSDSAGVFWQTLPPTLVKGNVYFAKVEIEYSGVTYSSGLTFNLRVPTDEEQAQQMMNMLTNIQDVVGRVDTNLVDLATAQAAFRQATTEKLDMLTNAATAIQAGVTNLEAKLDMLSTQALAQLEILTNTIGVIGPGETNVVDMLESLVSGGATMEARILTRPTSVKFGSTLDILYRSKEGLTVTYQVMSTADTGPMTGAGGVYEATLTANWGLGDFQIVCSDSSGASDRMILKVTASDIDDLALTMGSVSSQLGRVEGSLTNMMSMVSNVNLVVGSLTDLTNMVSQVEILTNAIGRITVLTNMSSQLNYVTSIVGQVAAVTNLGPSLGVMTNMLTGLGPLTNFSGQMDYMTNIVGRLTTLTNVGDQVAVMTGAVGRVAALTNLIPQVAYLTNAVGIMGGQVGNLTNLVGRMTPLTNVPAQIALLTNMPTQLSGIETAIGQLGSLTNLGPQVDALSASLDQIIAITNMASQMDAVAAAVGNLSSLTNLGPQVDALSASLDQIIAITNMASQMDAVANAVGNLSSLTNLGPQVEALSASLDQIIALTNMTGQMDTLVGAVGQLGGLTSQVDQVFGAVQQMAVVTNIMPQVDQIATAIEQLGGITNLGPQVDQLTAAMGQIVALTNMATQVDSVAAMVGQLSVVTNLGAQVDQVLGAVQQMAVVTNMMPKVDQVVDSLAALGSVTNLGPQVDQLTAAMGEILALTNVAGQIAAVQAAVTDLGAMTNMIGQVDVLVAGMTNLQSSSLAISNAQAALTAAMGEILPLTNIVGQVNGLLTGMDELQGSTAAISNALAALMAAMQEVGDMGTNFTVLANLQGSISGVAEMSSNLLYSIEDRLGMATDPAGVGTVFGQLASIEQNLTGVGGTTKQALQKATSARTEAQNAATAIGEVKKRIGAGQLNQAMSDLAAIRKSLGAAAEQMKGIGPAVSTEDLVKSLREAMNKMDEMAKARGLQPLGQPAELQEGALTDPQTVAKLMNSIAETKAMMEAMRLLMDEAVNKPVVVDWMEGVK